MTAFPASPAFSGPTPSVGVGVPKLENLLLACLESIGTGLQTVALNAGVRISSGSITPLAGLSASIQMDTEASAASDDLTNIAQSVIADGRYVMLQIADNVRAVVVKHDAGGTGDIQLAGGIDFEMNRTDQRLLLQRSGVTWIEVLRSGREKEHLVNAAGEPAFQNSWAAGSVAPAFWKDENGVVRLRGFAAKTSVAVSNSVIFTLPAGYRPSGDVTFPAWTSVGATTEINAIVVLSNGNVAWNRVPLTAPSTVTVNAYLSSVSFRAEA